MKVGLFYSSTGNNNGPGKVVSNLIKGLQSNNIDICINSIGDVNGCLQSWNVPLNFLPDTTVIGPNMCVLPTEIPHIWYKFKTTIVPCEWVKRKYESFSVIKDSKIDIKIWPVGIDTDYFIPTNEIKLWDILLYVKNKTNEANQIEAYLSDKGFKVNRITYGNYTENEFKNIAQKSKCAILLTKTESQGIAYQEIMSMGVPCYVINKNVWDDIDGYSFLASSVPYFDPSCGMIENNLNNFESFYEQLSFYNPREFVLNNLNLKKQANDYLNILLRK
jgi:glycosyltransferase involved in cell wall biosynthesis